MSSTTRVVTTVTNASTKTYSYSGIDLLDAAVATLTDQIDVYLTPANTGIQVQLTPTTEYTYATLPTKEITLVGSRATNLAVGDIITIRRSTKDDARYTDFTDLGFLRSEDVNTNGDQLLFLIQEARTDVQDALIKTADQTKWQGEGLPSTNCASAIDSTGWTTYAQVQSMISGADVADVLDGVHSSQSGDGTTTAFELPTFPVTEVNKEKLFIAIDGIVQNPTGDYTYDLVDGTPTVTFTSAPPDETTVDFRTVPGLVTSTYGAETIDGDSIVINTLNGNRIEDGTVDGDAIAAGTLPVTAIEAAAGDDNRFIVVNSSGTPSLTTITNDNIENTGRCMPATFTSSTMTTGSGALSYTNSSSTNAVFFVLDMYTSGGATVTFTPPSAAGRDLAVVGSDRNRSISLFVPAGGSVSISGTGVTYRYMVQEV